MTARRRATAAVVVTVTAAGLTGCAAIERAISFGAVAPVDAASGPVLLPSEQAVHAPCRPADLTPAGADPVERSLPFPVGITLLQVGRQKGGPDYTGFLAAPPDRARAVRASLVGALRGRGFVVGDDQAGPSSATASFTGPHRGRLVVQPLCRGLLAVRYEVRDPAGQQVPAVTAPP